MSTNMGHDLLQAEVALFTETDYLAGDCSEHAIPITRNVTCDELLHLCKQVIHFRLKGRRHLRPRQSQQPQGLPSQRPHALGQRQYQKTMFLQ